MAEFKISRLRFEWSGEWAPATFYNRDAVVYYSGKMYVCRVPNTSSADFNDDLNYLTPGNAPEPRWSLVINGVTWSSDWETNTLYSEGEIVKFGGAAYICTEAHTSNSTAIDISKFDTYTQYTKWNNAWTTSRAYGVGDVVKYGGIVYVCTANHTSANTNSLGLEPDILNWDILNNGIDYKGDWNSASIRYKVNDVVKLGPSLYIATAHHTSITSFDDTKWSIWLPGEEFLNIYSSSTIYQPGDVVTYGGYSYVSNTTSNQGNTPSIDAIDWSILNTGYSFQSEWTSGSYKIGAVVRRGGMLFEAIVDSSGQDPIGFSASKIYNSSGSSGTTLVVNNTTNVYLGAYVIGQGFTLGQTVESISDGTTLIISAAPDSAITNGVTLSFIGVNGAYWKILTPSTQWTDNWENSTPYGIGDVVKWKNGTYVCKQKHTAAPSSRPDNDVLSAFWSLYIPHARKNALTTYGDLETFNNGAYSAVGIGTETYSLITNNQLPTWKHINSLPRIYYVSASNGIDQIEDDYGLTWDKPWRTVKYATEYVNQGTEFAYSADILSQNREWLTTEMYQWMLFQVQEENPPFTALSTFDQDKTIRDASYIVDALIYDMSRVGNSQTVAATLAYFKLGTTSTFFNEGVAEQMPYFIAGLERLLVLLDCVITNTEPEESYQEIMNFTPLVSQVILTPNYSEPFAKDTMDGLFDIVLTALSNQDTSAVPAQNSGTTSTIFVKTGTYGEELPIVVPANCAIAGDELRGVVIEPATSIIVRCTASSASTDLFTATDTTGLQDLTPFQFDAPVVNNIPEPFGGITPGTLYYIIGASVTPTSFAIGSTNTRYTVTGSIVAGNATITSVSSLTGLAVGGYVSGTGIPSGTKIFSIDTELSSIELTSTPSVAGTITLTITPPSVGLTTDTGTMTLYAGDAIKDMFYLQNGSGLRNMTLRGLLGTLSEADEFLIKRPTGGSYASLDPGSGTNDTKAWIYRRSPYVQNVTAFGKGCAALKIDGTLHNGGNKSIVCNDFTHILSNGVGVWCTGPGALTEAVSVFSYYGYCGYFAEAGGRIRATNGNTSYGTYGVIAEGYDTTEVPATGNVFNQSSQTQAQVQSAFGATAELLKINFSNAGSEYDVSTTNLLQVSNDFVTSPWASDGNILFTKNYEAPSGLIEAWSFQSTSASAGASYVHQNIPVTPKGKTYYGLSAVNVTGSGLGATFDVTVTSTGYLVTVNSGGSGYVGGGVGLGNQLYISGGQLGGRNSVNDCVLTVDALAGNAILSVIVTGTVPSGSDLNYTLSVYVKQGTANIVTLQGIFGSLVSSIDYNFTTDTITPSRSGGGFLPTEYGAETTLSSGWRRLWFAVNDASALETTLQFRIYPKGTASGSSNLITYVYGSQVEISNLTWLDYLPSFYLETQANIYTAYANFNITGAGTGVVAVGDEIRSRSVFETRVTDPGSGAGGTGYLTSSNNGQSGTDTYIQLAQSDTNLEANYIGMRLFINSGTGAGQYGYISAYDDSTKFAQILKESFDTLEVETTAASGSLLTLATTNTTDSLYVDQPIQFIPTYYTTAVSSTSLAQATVTATVGGNDNTLTVSSTLGMVVNMGVTFTGTVFSTITTGYIYFINEIIDGTTIRISEQLFGNVWPLTAATGSMTINFTSNNSYITASTANMVVNYPIQFTGTALGGLAVGSTYYINDIHDATHFSVSSSLVGVTVTATNPSDNGLTVASTASLIPLNPIVFSGTIVGGINIVEGTKYYISKIIDSFKFTVSSTLITRTVTETTAGSNLITVSSTSGLISNNPIQFVGTTFGGITAETTYYILTINDGFTFTISQTPGGGSLSLTNAEGAVTMKTAPAATVVTSSSGASMTGTTTSSKKALSLSIGSMNGTFSTSLFGNVVKGTTYYIKTIDSINKQITISESPGGSTFALLSKTGSMNLAAVGWDHVNAGTAIEDVLDNSSIYFIEPRTSYTEPEFTQTSATSTVTLPIPSNWVAMAHGDHYWIALPDGNSTAAGSSDGSTWTSITLPSVQNWTSIAYGSGYWVAISTGGTESIYSNSNGLGWRTAALPSSTTWTKVAYGKNRFVAVSTTGTVAYMDTVFDSWTSGSSVGISNITGLTYGGGKFLAVSSSGTMAYSTNGTSWTITSPLTASAWSDVTYGNGRFVAVSGAGAKTAYSFDGITWLESNIEISATKIAYGQGAFLALPGSGTTAYLSDSGLNWKKKIVSAGSYGCVTFGNTTDLVSGRAGYFVTLTGASTGTRISAGIHPQARAIITSGVITALSQWEAGSGYQFAPTVTFTDPNITSLATVTPRLSSGTLSSPTFINRGNGYNTNSTSVIVTGNGYADVFQTGLSITLNNLTRLPQPGDNLTFIGIDEIYKVTSATSVFGTEAPNLEANVEISPSMSVSLSPANGVEVSIRAKYSQARLTNHDFLNIGYGDFETSNYPGFPETGYAARSQDQVVEVDFGRVFFTSTDQDGNFKVGNLFGVQQATGIVTLSASQFGLTGLSTLSLGGIAVGGSSVVIDQFSTDGSFSQNSDTIIPTQRAIKTYVTNRLSQGGSNTFTGQLIAGTIVVGGPDRISSTVPNGLSGSNINMPSMVRFQGQYAGVDGGMAALDFFVRGFTRRGDF